MGALPADARPTGMHFVVACDGDDHNPGTLDQPFATLARAQQAVRQVGAGPVTVLIRQGIYYLDSPLRFGAQDSGAPEQPVTYAAYPGEQATISGGCRLDCHWQPAGNGIMRCTLPPHPVGGRWDFDQLFVNGQRQIRARYPNFDDSDPKGYSGYILAGGKLPNDLPADLVDPLPGADDDMTFSGAAPRGVLIRRGDFAGKAWARPQEAIIHIYQSHYWGNLQWRVKAIDWQAGVVWFGEGGQQMGAKWFHSPCEVNERSYFFIENVLEELDAPGEWYLDSEAGVLYYWPPTEIDLATAVIEAPHLEQIVQVVGSQAAPVHDLTLRGLRFTHTRTTFLQPYTIPSLSDWAIHCGGALFMQGTRRCRIEGCFFDAVGGNALFLRDYNRDNVVSGCKFSYCGDSAICFVGSLETTVGTQRNFPYMCQATNNLIHDGGVFGKQVAGVYISRAKRITVAHNQIYRMPRAGICIGDGTWGGHLIEYNLVYDTCRETGDHGPFNAWGRDKYWCLVQSHTPYTEQRSHDAGRVELDAMETVVLRYNHFREKSGWGLDLDDGASNYEIYNNLCVGVSMKLREGAQRTVYNNIWVNGANSPCFHVGNDHNHDRYFRNITVMRVAAMRAEDDLNFEMGKGYGEIYTLIAPPAHGPWLEEMDYNCFYSDLGEFVARVEFRRADEQAPRQGQKYTLDEWRSLGFDRHSIFADPGFVDPEHNDYRLRADSPALQLGFQNFDIRQAGLLPEFPAHWRD